MKIIYCALVSCILFSCKKSTTDLPATPTPETSIPGVSTNGLDDGFFTLTANANGTYSGKGLMFNSILHRLGNYVTGEAVTSFSAYLIAPNGAYLEYNDAAYVIFYPTISGLNTNVHEDLVEYRTAYNTAIQNQTTIPLLDDYVEDEYGGTNSGITEKGIVVRDANSPSTFSIAPGSYRPVLYTGGIEEVRKKL